MIPADHPRPLGGGRATAPRTPRALGAPMRRIGGTPTRLRPHQRCVMEHQPTPRTEPFVAARRDLLRRSLVGALAGAAGRMACADDAPRVGALAPPLVLHALDGRSIATRELLGKVVIATFWATWCAPCREELPLLSAFYERHRAQGLEVLGFSLDTPDDLAAVRDTARTLAFPVGLLGSAYAGAYGRIWRIPVSFTIDRRGILADDGWSDASPAWTPERLQRVVLPLLRA